MAKGSAQLDHPALRHARALLAMLGVEGEPDGTFDHAALAWRRAGLMAVTGRADGPGLVAPVAIASAADGALAALRLIAPGRDLPTSGALLLGERARLLGLTRRGAICANTACRLIPTRDGLIALNLPRAADWEMMPALFGAAARDWAAVERLAGSWCAADLVRRGRLLGLAIAADAPASIVPPFRIEHLAMPQRLGAQPLVIDLSALWAGPLAGSLLHMAGARVVKVESVHRADGARAGDGRFYDLLNAGKSSVALDFRDASDVNRLRKLIDAADIVIESARPRGLADLGVDVATVVARGATWISITAHGRTGEAAYWIGFGDDAAVAGGLASAMASHWSEPLFAGDAIADPLTGITAALAGWASWLSGGGRLISLALADVIAQAIALDVADDVMEWQRLAVADTAPLYPLRMPTCSASPLSADTHGVLSELGIA